MNKNTNRNRRKNRSNAVFMRSERISDRNHSVTVDSSELSVDSSDRRGLNKTTVPTRRSIDLIGESAIKGNNQANRSKNNPGTRTRMIRIVAKQKAEYERNNRSLKIRLYSFVALFITCLLIGSIWFQKTSNLNFSFLELKNPISTAQRQHVKNKNRLPPGIDFLKKGAPKK